MNALLLSLVLSCGNDPNCACAHGKDKQAATPAATKAAPAAVGSTAPTAPVKAEPAKAEAKAEAKTDGILLRGEKLKGLPAVELTKLLATPNEFNGKTVALEGTVRKACEKKGCWMELAASDKGPGIRVTFKDYGFFVPLDSAGSKAKLEGTVQVAELTAEKAKHYESEGAQITKDKDGKYREIQVVALGVELRK